jgi:VWFA-related protein
MFTAVARLVPISVTVRDGNGRPVTGLTAKDFEVLSDDQPKAIQQFYSEPSAITTALLMDRSGSMRVGTRTQAANEAAHHVVSWMSPEKDRIGVFAFDTNFGQTASFAPVSAQSLDHLEKVPPFGATSLYDALDFTGTALVSDGAPRRAVVAITDGVDTASLLTADEVTRRASAIDVPVYVIAVALNIDVTEEAGQSELARLTEGTGGRLFMVNAPAHASKAARTLVTELRQQYLIAFTPDTRPGWHRLTVRTRQHHTTVRARAGYVTR